MPNRMLRDWTDSLRMEGLSANAERLFVRMIMRADDYGRFHSDPRLIKANCFPLADEISASDIAPWLSELADRGMVITYHAEGRCLLAIVNYGQRLRTSRAKFPPLQGMPGDWLPLFDLLPPIAASCGNSRTIVRELRPEAEGKGSGREAEAEDEEEDPPNPQGGDFVFDEDALDPSNENVAHCYEDGDSGARDALPANERPDASPNVPSEALRGKSQNPDFRLDPEIPLTEKTSSEILPSGWNRLAHAERGRKRVVRNTPIMVRIGKFFGQRESTLWTISDYLALKDVSPNEDDLQLLEDHYSLELENNGYRITSIQTLLNQWPKACSKANIYFSENPNHR